MKRILLFISLFTFLTLSVSGQQVGVQTNTLYWATTTPNVGVSLGVGDHWSLSLHAGWNPLRFRSFDHPESGERVHPKMFHWTLMPEAKYWFCRRFEYWNLGLHAIATQYTNEAGYTGYFTWEEAKALQMPAGYHLPTYSEWLAILGSDNSDPNRRHYVNFNENEANKDVYLSVQIPGQTEKMDCLQDYKQVSAESAVYMIRYKNNDTYRSAWRYSWADGPIAGQKVLKIEAVPVKAGLTIEQLNKDYFALPKVSKYVKTIYLPATGTGYSSSSGRGRGSWGDYWATTKDNSLHICNVSFDSNCAYAYNYKTTDDVPVRPFRNL